MSVSKRIASLARRASPDTLRSQISRIQRQLEEVFEEWLEQVGEAFKQGIRFSDYTSPEVGVGQDRLTLSHGFQLELEDDRAVDTKDRAVYICRLNRADLKLQVQFKYMKGGSRKVLDTTKVLDVGNTEYEELIEEILSIGYEAVAAHDWD